MNARLSGSRLSLDRDGIFTLEHAQGLELRNLKGSLWITTPDLPGDHYIGAGASFTIPGKGRVVIEALEAAEFALGSREIVAQRSSPQRRARIELAVATC